MYSSNPTDYQKFTASPQQSAPPPYSHPATGIPVSSTNEFYHEMPHHQPPSAPSLYGQPQSGVPVNSGNQYYSEKPQPAIQVLPKSQVPWSTGLCDCFDDVPNCCMTCWCPCITFGRIAEIVDKGSTSCGASGALYTLISIVVGCPCFYSCFYRSKMRQQYLLHKSPCGDCLVHCCCESCALCQEQGSKYRPVRSVPADSYRKMRGPRRILTGIPVRLDFTSVSADSRHVSARIRYIRRYIPIHAGTDENQRRKPARSKLLWAMEFTLIFKLLQRRFVSLSCAYALFFGTVAAATIRLKNEQSMEK